jgi:enoyl-CoA hydratase/carnithine racemase
MRELADMLDRVSDNIASIYAEADRKGKDADYWRALMREEKWFSADEAVEFGLADRVVGAKGSDKTDNKWDLSIFNYGGRKASPAPELPVTNGWDPEMIRRAFEEARK